MGGTIAEPHDIQRASLEAWGLHAFSFMSATGSQTTNNNDRLNRRLVAATFERNDLIIRLRIDPDAVTGSVLETLSSKGSDSDSSADRTMHELRSAAALLSLFVVGWDADEPPTADYFLTLPVGLLFDLYNFCWGEVCPHENDVRDYRRFLLSGGRVGYKPNYADDFEDARLLRMKPWEMADVPLVWRQRARVIDTVRKQVRLEIANKAKIPASYVLET